MTYHVSVGAWNKALRFGIIASRQQLHQPESWFFSPFLQLSIPSLSGGKCSQLEPPWPYGSLCIFLVEFRTCFCDLRRWVFFLSVYKDVEGAACAGTALQRHCMFFTCLFHTFPPQPPNSSGFLLRSA